MLVQEQQAARTLQRQPVAQLLRQRLVALQNSNRPPRPPAPSPKQTKQLLKQQKTTTTRQQQQKHTMQYLPSSKHTPKMLTMFGERKLWTNNQINTTTTRARTTQITSNLQHGDFLPELLHGVGAEHVRLQPLDGHLHHSFIYQSQQTTRKYQKQTTSNKQHLLTAQRLPLAHEHHSEVAAADFLDDSPAPTRPPTRSSSNSHFLVLRFDGTRLRRVSAKQQRRVW